MNFNIFNSVTLYKIFVFFSSNGIHNCLVLAVILKLIIIKQNEYHKYFKQNNNNKLLK